MGFYTKSLIILVAVVFMSYRTMAQTERSSRLGVSVVNDWWSEGNRTPAVGFVFEHQFSPKSGIEIGAFYKAQTYKLGSFSHLQPDGTEVREKVKLRENYISVPVVYRYYSKVVNLSIGSNFEYFTGWNQINGENLAVDYYNSSPEFDFGPLTKISKQISLGKNLFIEPELRFGIMARSSLAYYGVGVQLKGNLR